MTRKNVDVSIKLKSNLCHHVCRAQNLTTSNVSVCDDKLQMARSSNAMQQAQTGSIWPKAQDSVVQQSTAALSIARDSGSGNVTPRHTQQASFDLTVLTARKANQERAFSCSLQLHA